MDSGNGQTFKQLLTRLLLGTRWRALLHGLSVLGTWTLGGLLAAAWALGGDVEPAPFIAGGLAISLALGVVAVLLRWVLAPWRHLRRREDFVGFLETQGAFGNILVAAEEAPRGGRVGSGAASPLGGGRGRAAGYPAPPAQIPACGTIALGSYLGSDAQTLVRIRMDNMRVWEPSLRQALHPVPGDIALLAPAAQPQSPQADQLVAEGPQGGEIARDGVVVHVSNPH